MKEALAQDVALEKKRHSLTLEALREVNAGRTSGHEVLEKWAATLARKQKSKR